MLISQQMNANFVEDQLIEHIILAGWLCMVEGVGNFGNVVDGGQVGSLVRRHVTCPAGTCNPMI